MSSNLSDPTFRGHIPAREDVHFWIAKNMQQLQEEAPALQTCRLTLSLHHQLDCGALAQNQSEEPTFDSWQVDSCVLVYSDSVSDNPERAFFVRPGARDQLTLPLPLQVDDTHVDDGTQIGEGFHHSHV